MREALYMYHYNSGKGQPLRPLHELNGRIVYVAYSTAQCGVIVDAMVDSMGRTIVRVKRLNGDTSEHTLTVLKDYEDLVEDHERKYFKHSDVVARLKKLNV